MPHAEFAFVVDLEVADVEDELVDSLVNSLLEVVEEVVEVDPGVELEDEEDEEVELVLEEGNVD